MGSSEWNTIFHPSLMQSDVYRNLKCAIVEQEAAVYEGEI